MLTAKNIQGDLQQWLKQVGTLSDDIPVLLTPLRVEARFMTLAPLPGGIAPPRDILWVRIFPDDFLLYRHEKSLTQQEADATRQFWKDWFAAGENRAAKVNAWANLTGRITTHRAAWAIRELDPRTRVAAGAMPQDQDFPEVTIKTDEWTEPVRAIGLPDQFVVMGSRGGVLTHISVGAPLPETLQISLHPDAEAAASFTPNADGNLDVAPALQWLTDPNEATRQGMAVVVPLSASDSRLGFDELYVLGIRTKNDSPAVLEQLLQSHRYSPNGLGFTPPGTPTNNTPDVSSGYGTEERNAEWSYDLEFGDSPFQPADADRSAFPDSQRLARALGTGSEIFPHLENRALREVADAENFRSLLWYGTMGAYMEDFFEKIFTCDNIERTRIFFNRHVAATGHLPVLRVGKQPYGILPATAFSKLYIENPEALWVYKAEEKDPELKAQARFDARLATFLFELHQYWTQLGQANVKSLYGSLMPATDQSALTNTFLEMLGLQPNSVDYHARYGANLARANEAPFMNIATSNATSAIKTKLSNLMMSGDYRSFAFYTTDQTPTVPNRNISRNLRMESMQTNQLRFWNKNISVQFPLVAEAADPGKPMPAIEGSDKTPVDWLLENSLDDIRKKYNLLPDTTGPDTPPVSMLFNFLRTSMLGMYRKAATRILLKEDFFPEHYLRLLGTPEKFSFPNRQQMPQPLATYTTPWSLLFWPMNKLQGLDGRSYNQKALYNYLGTNSLSQFLAPGTNALLDAYPEKSRHAAILHEIETFRRNLADLRSKNVGQLERLLSGHIDLCTYRLDAWMTGLAAQKLEQQRRQRPEGIWLGAYGYLENLRRNTARTAAENVPDELKNAAGTFPILSDANNQGFVHAPSIQQAITAAVLRSSYDLTGRSTPQAKRMAVNLSSARVRRALQLVDGLSAGISISQLLGQQLERGLHERFADGVEMDVFIQPLRRLFPLEFAVQDTSPTTPPPGYVINGYTLLQEFEAIYDAMPANTPDPVAVLNIPSRWTPKIAGLFLTTSIPQYSAAQRRTFFEEVDKLADTFDAFGDLLLSESVYQLVQGNRARAAAVLNASTEGRVPPPPEIVQTPHSGVNIQQRIWCSMKAVAQAVAPAGWNATLSARAAAEPSLNHWLASMIGPANQVRCICHFQKSGSAGTETVEISVAQLLLQPIDLYCLAAGSADNGHQECLARLGRFLQTQSGIGTVNHFTADLYARGADWTAQQRSLGEVLEMLSYLGKSLTESRFAAATDFNAAATPSTDLTQLRQRVQTAHHTLVTFHTAVQNFIGMHSIGPETVLEDPTATQQGWSLLLKLADFGISGALPLWNEPAWTRRLLTAFGVLDKRLKEAERMQQLPENERDEMQVLQQLCDWGKAVFGQEFLLLPLFQPGAGVPATIATQLNQPDAQSLLRHDPGFTLEDWLDDVAAVRPKMLAWDKARLLNNPLDDTAARPLQFPYRPGDYWVGAAAPPEFWAEIRDRNFLSVVVLGDASFTGDPVWTGLILDEWIEMVPDRVCRTGVAFHYNQPDARPPQSFLLAVSPQITGQWDAENLYLTIKETMEMARNRLVEPEHLLKSDLSHLLPGILAEMKLDKNNILQTMSQEILHDGAWVSTQLSQLNLPT